MFGSENAFFFVLLHAALNESPEDDAATLAMLDVLLEKGLSISPRSVRVYWVKDKPEDAAKDYIAEMPLVETAIGLAFPEAVEKLLKAGASFAVDTISEARKRDRQDIVQLLEKYKDQAK